MKRESNIEPELNSLLAKLTVEIDRDEKEIEILKKRVAKNYTLQNAIKGSLGAFHTEGKSMAYGAKLDTIKDAIRGIATQQFTPDDVENMLNSVSQGMEINRNRLRAALWTLATRKNFIRLVRKGNNQQPALYEKTNGSPAQDTASLPTRVTAVPSSVNSRVTNADIRGVLERLSGSFSASGLANEVARSYPSKELIKTKVPSLLHELKNDGKLRVLDDKRSGRQGFTYVKV
jgi:hypothetical protein